MIELDLDLAPHPELTMSLRRLVPSALVITLLGAMVMGTSPAEEPEPTPEPAPTPTPEPSPAAEPTADAPCASWSHPGQPVEHISDLMDADKMKAIAGVVGLDIECHPTNADSYRELHCVLTSQEWSITAEVFEFDDPDDARWDHERSFAGRTTRIDGDWLLVTQADNGPCSAKLLDTLVPPGSALTDFDPLQIGAMFAPLGWSPKHEQCDVEEDHGRHPFHADHCRIVHGERWAASTSVVQRPKKKGDAEKTRRVDKGTAFLDHADGDAEVTVFDTASAEAMMAALLR